MLATLLLGLLAVANAEPYLMNDVGATLELPRDWSMSRWSDWDFKAEHKDGMLLYVWLTPFQVDVSEEAARAWGDMYARGIEAEGAHDPKVTDVRVEEIGGRPTAHVALTFRLRGKGPPGVAHAMAFTSAGQVVHARIITGAPKEKKALGMLREMMASMQVTKAPLPTGGPDVQAGAGFGATLPAGWRPPLEGEMEPAMKVAAKIGQDKFNPSLCWLAIRPPPDGAPDVMIACKVHQYLGVVDEYSFSGEESDVHAMFFGSAKEPVPTAEQAHIGDRLGFYYRVKGGALPVRLALAPFSGGLMMLWGFSSHMDAATLDQAMMATLPGVKFTAAGGGQPIVGADRRVAYYVKYRPLVVAGVMCPFLAFGAAIAGVVAMVRGRSTRRRRMEEY